MRGITRLICAASLVATLALAAGCGGAGPVSGNPESFETDAPAQETGGFEEVAPPTGEAPEFDSGDSFQDILP